MNWNMFIATIILVALFPFYVYFLAKVAGAGWLAGRAFYVRSRQGAEFREAMGRDIDAPF
jgi:hypothetical protein